MARFGIGEILAIRRHRRQQRRMQQQRRRGNNSSGCDCGDMDCGACDCNPFMLGSILGLMALATPTRTPRTAATTPGRAGMLAIRGYQRWLSPHLRTHCRQTPSCSSYGLQAVQRYGLVEGSRLTAARIRRCNPATPHGTHNPVP